MNEAGGQRQANDSWEHGLAAMLSGMADAVGQIAQTSGTGTSPDGKVTVEVAANGTAKSVRINDPRIPEEVRRALALAVKDAVNAAVSQLRTKQQTIKGRIAGPLEGGREPVDYLRAVDPSAADEAEKFLAQVRAGQVPPAPPRPAAERSALDEPEHSNEWLRMKNK